MGEASEPADELIARARRVYSECRAYSDEGRVRTEFRTPGGELKHASEKRFRTRWRRPSEFLFECVAPPHFKTWDTPADKWERYVIWTTGEGTQSWWTTTKQIERGRKLEEAIAAATGVSSETSFNIPTLLRAVETPAQWFPSPTGFHGVVAEHDGRECVCISMLRGEREQQLWLERSTGLVLRLDSSAEFTAERQRADCFRNVERLRAEMVADPASAPRYESLLRSFEREAEQAARKEFVPFTSITSTAYRPKIDPELGAADFLFVPPDR